MEDYKKEQWWIELQEAMNGFNENSINKISDGKLNQWNGSKISGNSALKSGQLLKAAINGGKKQGKITGKQNVENGHLAKIRNLAISKEVREKAKLNTDYKSISQKLKKPIFQYNLNGEFIAKFDSVLEAANFVGCKPCSITNVAKGKSKSCKKSIWKYD